MDRRRSDYCARRYDWDNVVIGAGSIFRSAWKNQKLYAVMQRRTISASGSAARFQSNWKDLAMLKFCLFAIGVLAGTQIPKRNRRQAGWIAAADRENH